ncbi:Nramp family divalent metal transporter [Algoriphagus litoralis]|uniref:Nramp family divalent metal transporter n=1 Tax=Algoriphagus litoralis TaxID=2202829 RepID=UPI000DB9B5CF|nr:Nramp family divalent metal transporter [Algoriphagus litoralis]
MNVKNPLRNIGPGPLIAAAFIGPGTVTVCTLAGANFGFSLLWALVLSIVATVILQEISGRIGIVTGSDLSSLVRNQTGNRGFRLFSMILILVAVVLGNAAYESGNISGANLGLDFYWTAPTLDYLGLQLQSGNFILGIIAFLLLWSGSYKALERVLMALVILMSIAFSVTAILTKPDFSALLRGFIPTWNSAEIPTLVALIGTTVVPYNLFLYASLVNKRWKNVADLPLMRRDIAVSVILGGIVSMAILIVGAANTSEEITSAIDVSRGLEAVFGRFAGYMMGFGLLAAGLTSSLTAPLAAGFVVCGIMGWDQEIKSKPMRISMGIIVGLGLLFSSFGIKPVQLITLAQLANGILLPVISGWIIWIASQSSVLGKFKNSSIRTGIAGLIWLITLVLGLKSIGTVFGWF